MAKFEKFEDIEAWQICRALMKSIYEVTSRNEFARDFPLRDQIRKAAISALSNIAEGFERGGDKEFRQFLSVAKGSIGEMKAQLYAAFDAGYLKDEKFQDLMEMADHAARKIGSLMQYLASSEYKGVKFRDSDAGLETRDAGLKTQDAGLETRDAGLKTQDAGLKTQDAGLETRDAGLHHG